MMSPDADRMAQLSRMEEARRQTEHQLHLIERQIARKFAAIMPQLARRQAGYRRGKPPHSSARFERYRKNLAALIAERQPEIDALSRKLARQEAAIGACRERLSAGNGPARTHAEV